MGAVFCHRRFTSPKCVSYGGAQHTSGAALFQTMILPQVAESAIPAEPTIETVHKSEGMIEKSEPVVVGTSDPKRASV